MGPQRSARRLFGGPRRLRSATWLPTERRPPPQPVVSLRLPDPREEKSCSVRPHFWPLTCAHSHRKVAHGDESHPPGPNRICDRRAGVAGFEKSAPPECSEVEKD